MRERIKLETRTRTVQSTGGVAWTITATETRWAEAIAVTAEAQSRYDSIDKVVQYELRFRGRPTIDMKNTRFVWMTDGSPNEGRVYEIAAPPENVDGVGRLTSVLISDTGESIEVAAEVAMTSTSEMEAVASV